ncbi:b05a4d56-04e7-4832-8fd7-1777951de8d0 [Thermothielavioides terrestris]|uniref:Carboxylic ester hydrolase n=1 Tax=Thermothielavioides terrestris TaxID=2587410 RepID=A0A3S4ASG3_9PEZI|nr:b05a4d56-04e7-4832-8fd7-1777951de8d0 [Thermothielavioides terrestris]
MRSTDVTWWFCAALVAVTPTGLAAATGTPSCSKTGPGKLLTVATSNGPVTGHIAPNTSCVVEYLGIPYAKPPVGDLRFAAPQPLDCSDQRPYVAANFGFDCPLTPSKPVDYPGFTPQAQRIINYFASGAGTPQSEDCLTLNIWSKATSTAATAKKPVIVFFYGGRFTIGNTDSPFYNGRHLADAQDLVVVTVNYRINIFGFPGAPGQTQNLGLRDQRLAVEWVQKNIARFGGDASRIVLAGQSSGGVAVDYWAYAHEQDAIAAGLILVSGNAFSFPLPAPATATKNWNTVVAAVGCNTTADQSAVMACMRAANWTDIKAAAAAIKPGASTSVLRSVPAFYPQVDNEFVFADYLNRTQAGRFARLPLLGGNNNNEAGYYRIPAFASGVVPTDAQVAAFHLESFTCPVAHQAAARTAFGVPAWAYRYFADWDNTRLYPGSGAYHGVDLHMVFGASAEVSGLPTSAEQRALTALVQRAWYVFASDPWNGLQRELGWPRWQVGRPTLAVLGQNNTAQPRFVDPNVYAAPCSTVTLGALGTPTASATASATAAATATTAP